ncbi:MAG: succinylglutamate desuccinylase/aspartoacylase family protein [Saprospiraceae bacterium]
MTKRIITYYEGEPGPLFVVTAGMHGNEQAGIKALIEVGKLLQTFKNNHTSFKFRGTLLGLIGNIQAKEQYIRYVSQDLNRMWETEFVYKILESEPGTLQNEEKEMYEIVQTLRSVVLTGKYSRLILLDLHTTSSDGIFSICTEDKESITLANQLHAPVVRGLMKGIKGTTLHYFNRNNLGIEATSLAFEAGRHDDIKSVNRSIAAMINCMRSIGCVSPESVQNEFDELLINYSKNLPKSVEVHYKYNIQNNQEWEMVAGFKNFDVVKKGQILAHEEGKAVLCPLDGLILMPLYQKKGNDGFFIVTPL